MEDRDFIIFQVGWLTSIKGNESERASILSWVTAITNYLQENSLLRRPLLIENDSIDDSFCIKASDLTEEGLQLMKLSFDKWLSGVDNGNDPHDVKILDKTLQKLRKGS